MSPSKYVVGERLRVRASAWEDVGTMAWPYLDGKVGIVKNVDVVPTKPVGTISIAYVLEFDEDFAGGWDCYGMTTAHRGQFIGQQHLEPADA